MNGLMTLAFFSRETLLLAITVPVAVGVGFALGILYERWHHAAELQRVTRRFEKLFAYTTGLLERAEKVCGLLNEQVTRQPTTTAQQSQLQMLTSRLVSQLTNLSGLKFSEHIPNGQTTPVAADGTFQPPHWQIDSLDERTGLPDAIAYDGNLQRLLRSLEGKEVHCGVLFVQVDQYQNLIRRMGASVAEQFVQRTASIVLRHLRDTDLLCQITEDVLIALLPNVNRQEMEAIANAARKSMRNNNFLHHETGQPVFITASFGYSLLGADLGTVSEPAQELWQQGQLALQASQKRGRCQLHEITPAGTSRLVAG